MLVLTFCLATLLLGVAYSKWSSGFDVSHQVSSYDFDLTVNDEAIDENNSHEAEFYLDEDLKLEIKNIGTVGAYLDEFRVEFQKSSCLDVISMMEFDARIEQLSYDVTIKGKRLSRRPVVIDYNKDNGIIEPYDINNDIYVLHLDKINDVSLYIQELEELIRDINSEIASLESSVSSINSQIASYEALLADLKYELCQLTTVRFLAPEAEANDFDENDEESSGDSDGQGDIEDSDEPANEESSDQEDNEDSGDLDEVGLVEEQQRCVIDYWRIEELQNEICSIERELWCLYLSKCSYNIKIRRLSYELCMTSSYLDKVIYAYEHDTLTLKTTFKMFNE